MCFFYGGAEVELYKKWSVHMKNNISGGAVMPPTLDHFDPSVFYVSDGWYSYYSSIRLRRLSLETGEELANVLTRDCVRCIHMEEDRLFAILNKRILELNRNDLSVRRAYKKGVPQYSDYTGFNGQDKLLLMNSNGSFLSVFDLTTEKVQKKKVDTCCGILRETPNSFLIMDGKAVLQYDLEKNKLQTLMVTEPYTDCVQGTSRELYLLGAGADGEARIWVYPSAAGGTPQEITLSEPVQGFKLSSDETQAFLLRKDRLLVYSIPEKRVTAQHIFLYESSLLDGNYVLNDRTILTYQREGTELTCWSIVE